MGGALYSAEQRSGPVQYPLPTPVDKMTGWQTDTTENITLPQLC